MDKLKYIFSLLLTLQCVIPFFAQYATLPSPPVANSYLSNPFGYGNGTTGAQMLSDLKYNYILTSTELSAAGVVPNSQLNSIGFNFYNGLGIPYPNLTIAIKHISSNLLSAFDNIGLTQVYSGNFSILNTGWQHIPFLNSFTWNGSQNILVSICWDRTTSGFGANVTFYSTGSLGRAVYNQATSGSGCNLSSVSQSQNVPITRFGLMPLITSFNPQSIFCTNANPTITVTGNHFIGTTSVLIGGVSVAFNVVSNTQININNSNGAAGIISITNVAGTTSSSTSFWIDQAPSTPLNPTSNSPQCGPVTITRSGNPPAGETWYWQGVNSNGSSTALGSGPNYTANSTGTYYIRAQNTVGCWSNSSGATNVVVDSYPIVPAAPTSNSPQCNSVTITRTGTPPAGITWHWQGTNANGTSTSLGSGLTFIANTTGTYYIRAMNSTGCWSATSNGVNVIVNSFPITITNPISNSPQCGSVILTRLGSPPAGENFYWQGTNPNGTSTALGSGVNFTVYSSGTYYIRSQNTSGCWSQGSGSVSVIVNSFPNFPTQATSNSPQCNSVLITRSGTPVAGEAWFWQGTNPNGVFTNLGSGPTFTANTSGTYYLRSRTSQGCWSTNSSSINVVVYTSNTGFQSVSTCDSFTWVNGITYQNSTNTPILTIDGGSVFGCDSNVILNLTIYSSYNMTQNIMDCESYTWIDGVNYISSTSTPTFTLSTNQGCDSVVHLNLTLGFPSIDTAIVEASSLGSYFLNNIEYIQSGTYYQSFQDQFGCDSVIQLNLIIEPVGISQEVKTEISVFPNPSFDGKYYLKNYETLQDLSVFDVLGKNIFIEKGGDYFDISKEKSGVYFLKINTFNGHTSIFKLILNSN